MTTWLIYTVQSLKDSTHLFLGLSGSRGTFGRLRLNHNRCILTWKYEKQIFLKTLTVSILLFLSKCSKTEPFPLNLEKKKSIENNFHKRLIVQDIYQEKMSNIQWFQPLRSMAQIVYAFIFFYS